MMTYLCLCAAITWIGHRLLNRFRTRRPDLVANYLPEAADHFRHPSKLFFFLRPTTVKILSGEPELLRLRRWLIRLLWAVPIFFVCAAAFLILLSVYG